MPPLAPTGARGLGKVNELSVTKFPLKKRMFAL